MTSSTKRVFLPLRTLWKASFADSIYMNKFRALQNIYDGAFCEKKTLLTCFVKRSILNVRLDSEYNSTYTYSKDFSTSWLNPLCANPTKQSNTLKQFVGKKPTNCLCVFDHFLGLVLKGLIFFHEKMYKLSLTQKRIQNPVKCLRWSKCLVADENT